MGETVGATEAPDDFSERLWEPMPEPVPAVSVLQATQNDDKGDDDEKTETQTAETNVVAPGVVTSDVTASGGTDAADTTVEPDQPVAVPAVPAITETREAIQTETTAVESTPEIENEPTVTKPVPTEQEVASQPSAKKPEWIPFIYYYRQSMTMYGPVKTLYIVPFDPKMQSAPQVTPPPALRPRLYPVVLMPVFPVFLICH